MDLTIPYTFYPLALPHWMAWALFLTVVVAGTAVGLVRGRAGGWRAGLRSGFLGGLALLAASMLASMVIAFFVHDL